MLNYREIFPQTGGTIAVSMRKGVAFLQTFEWHSRGAPLRLSYQFLPDRYYRLKRFAGTRKGLEELAAAAASTNKDNASDEFHLPR